MISGTVVPDGFLMLLSDCTTTVYSNARPLIVYDAAKLEVHHGNILVFLSKPFKIFQNELLKSLCYEP